MQDDIVTFRFKQFAVTDRRCGMKVGTDAVLIGALAIGESTADVNMDFGTIKVADIGAGCGIIALMIAQRFPMFVIDAIEIDSGAVADMRINVSDSPWSDRINVIEGDFNELSGSYDYIISNPPYFCNGEVAPETNRAIARHAGSLSPASLVEFASGHLSPSGSLSMIVPSEAVGDIIAVASFKKLEISRQIDIATSPRRDVTRSFLEFVRIPSAKPLRKRLNLNGDEYRTLTRDYYLKF